MGKEWLFWGSSGGKSTKKLGRSGGGGGAAEREAAEVAAPTGCMCAVLQLFDLHQFQFALHHQPSFREAGSFLHDEPCIANKGLEAPRNSLELDEPLMESDSSSSSTRRKEQENLDIPVSIQIKTTRENKSPRASFSKATRSTTTTTDDLFSDSCGSDSPAGGNKTPTLVARLMGLDQLPPQVQTSTTPPASSTINSRANSHMYRHSLHGLQSLSREHQHSQYSGLSGLQILNQNRSCSHRSFFDKDITAGTGTLSLPETPRISSARRSDVDHGHRLSLQINKENISEEFEISAYSSALKNLARKRRQLVNKQADEEHRRSGSDYARDIVKQVKESVSRKVGLDITNTIKSRDQKIRTDDRVVLLKPKKPSDVNVTKVGHGSDPSKQSTPSCSPRLLDPINKPLSAKNQTNSHSPRLLSSWSPSPENQQSEQGKVHSTQKPQLSTSSEEQTKRSVVLKKCKKDGNEKYSSRFRRTSQLHDSMLKKQEEPFIRPPTSHKGNINVTEKKCKKTRISNDIFNISVPTLLPVKKQSQASSDGELRKRSTQISSCSSQAYKLKQQQQQVTQHMLNFQENNQDRCHRTTTSTPTPTSAGDQVVELEYRYYIQRILKRAGIDKATPVSLAKWYSPSHPLDPSTFHYIELFHPTVTNINSSGDKDSELNLRCNRKLVFQLVDELLEGILKPYLGGLRPCCWPRDQMYGSELIDALCSRIKKFPRADCNVLEDIDALIDVDFCKRTSISSKVHANYEEEGEGIVEEIQREIVKSLVHDTAMAIRTTTSTRVTWAYK